MGKNRVQKKDKQRDKPSRDNCYSKKHVRITLVKQEMMRVKHRSTKLPTIKHK